MLRDLAEKLRGRPLSNISTAKDRLERAQRLIRQIREANLALIATGIRKRTTKGFYNSIELRFPITIQRLWELEEYLADLKKKGK